MATPGRELFVFVACAFIWGTTWLAIKEGYGGLDPIWSASLRFFVAATILVGIIAVRRVQAVVDRRQLGVIVYVGLALYAFDYGLIYWGEQFLESGLTSVLFATMPLFVGLFAIAWLPNEPWTVRHSIGLGLALFGLVAIFRQSLSVGQADVWPAVAIVGAAAAAASASVVVRRWGGGIAPLTLSAGGMLLASLVLLATSIVMGEQRGLPQSEGAWWSIVYLATFGSVVSFLMYWWLLARWPAHRASLIALIIPIVALLAGFLWRDERLSLLQTLGTLLVLSGVAISLGIAKGTVSTPPDAPLVPD